MSLASSVFKKSLPLPICLSYLYSLIHNDPGPQETSVQLGRKARKAVLTGSYDKRHTGSKKGTVVT